MSNDITTEWLLLAILRSWGRSASLVATVLSAPGLPSVSGARAYSCQNKNSPSKCYSGRGMGVVKHHPPAPNQGRPRTLAPKLRKAPFQLHLPHQAPGSTMATTAALTVDHTAGGCCSLCGGERAECRPHLASLHLPSSEPLLLCSPSPCSWNSNILAKLGLCFGSLNSAFKGLASP